MALNLSFDISASEDGKYLIIQDTSSDFVSGTTYSFNEVLVSTTFDGLWESAVTDKVISPTAIKYTEDDTAVSTWESGESFYFNAEAIFGSGAEYIYDNLYSVTVTLDVSTGGTTSSETEALIYPLSRWYTNNKTAAYNYYAEDTLLMKDIITQHTWINVLDTAAQHGESGTIEVILKSFKSLIDGYGLPEE